MDREKIFRKVSSNEASRIKDNLARAIRDEKTQFKKSKYSFKLNNDELRRITLREISVLNNIQMKIKEKIKEKIESLP